MFIAIEGCIGTGKTTLAKLLASQYEANILLEATEKHPFIRDFYLKPIDYAFQTEMNFILIHYHQLQKIKQLGWFGNIVVSDFLFDKDLIFASLNLKNPLEFRLFKKTFDFLKKKIPEPDVVFYLKAPTKFLYKRIQERKREYEKNIPLKYLEELNKQYDRFFDNFPENKRIIFEAKSLDWRVNKDVSKEKVVSKFADLLKKYNLYSNQQNIK